MFGSALMANTEQAVHIRGIASLLMLLIEFTKSDKYQYGHDNW
jgi:hypothetical protein